MSKLRPELVSSNSPSLPDETALFLIRDSVTKRRALIYGHLDDGNGGHCALGCFFADNPKTTLHTSLVDEVAAVNDSLPSSALPSVRWKKVNEWLRWKVKILAAKSA